MTNEQVVAIMAAILDGPLGDRIVSANEAYYSRELLDLAKKMHKRFFTESFNLSNDDEVLERQSMSVINKFE